MPVLMHADPQRERRLQAELARIQPILIGLGAQKIILFGSLARGAAGRTSDLDLIVIYDTDLPFAARLDRFYSALAPRVALDLLVYTPREWERMSVSNPFVRQVLREGQVLYETSSAS